MPSRLGRNLRKGHLAEDIGMSVVRGFSAVADVRLQDDIGVDAYCVLLRPQKGLLYAEEPFSIQFKTISVKEVHYDAESTAWFKSIQIPLFFSRVDIKSGQVFFYTTTRYRRHLNVNSVSEIVFDFSSKTSTRENNKLIVGLDPPILQCSELESRTDEFAYQAHTLFKSWIRFEAESMRLQKFNIQVSAKWETGNQPESYLTYSMAVVEERHEHMKQAKPIIEMLSYHALGTIENDPELLKAFIRVFKWYQDEGFDDEFDNTEQLESQMVEWFKWKKEKDKP